MVYQLGNSEFKTKQQAKDYIKSIREKYEYGQILNMEDFDIIKDAIATMKEDKKPKIEDIDFIKIEKIDTGKPHKNFVIYLLDGQVAEFSIKNCFPPKNSKKDSHKENFNEAARVAVSDQIVTFKKQKNGYWCHLGNHAISEEEVHVDHDNPLFKDLVHDFIEVEGIQLDEIIYVKKNYKQKQFGDEKLKRKWQIYHQVKAKLQISCSQCNLRKKKQ